MSSETPIPSSEANAAAVADAALDRQRTFRLTLQAMARPGLIAELDTREADARESAPEPMNPAAAALALTLFDDDTPVWLDGAAATEPVREFLSFQCGCPIVEDPRQAAFALAAGGTPSLHDFAVGTDEFPESSTTVILQVERLADGSEVILSGPGIDGAASIAEPGLPAALWREWAELSALYPCGVDLILVHGRSLCCLPRTVRVLQEQSAGNNNRNGD